PADPRDSRGRPLGWRESHRPRSRRSPLDRPYGRLTTPRSHRGLGRRCFPRGPRKQEWYLPEGGAHRAHRFTLRWRRDPNRADEDDVPRALRWREHANRGHGGEDLEEKEVASSASSRLPSAKLRS